VAHVRVAVAGEGPALERLESMGAPLPDGRRIQYLGMRDDVEHLLAGADIFVMPSRTEALPMALIEAMGAGLPVVASGVGGIPEVVEHGREGWLVEPDDPRALASALDSLIGDGALRCRFGEAGRRRVLEQFTAHRMAEDYVRLFRRAAGGD
jgi:glycosyltransferase involved in cell wall biosynthesis